MQNNVWEWSDKFIWPNNAIKILTPCVDLVQKGHLKKNSFGINNHSAHSYKMYWNHNVIKLVYFESKFCFWSTVGDFLTERGRTVASVLDINFIPTVIFVSSLTNANSLIKSVSLSINNEIVIVYPYFFFQI